MDNKTTKKPYLPLITNHQSPITNHQSHCLKICIKKKPYTKVQGFSNHLSSNDFMDLNAAQIIGGFEYIHLTNSMAL